MSTPLLRAVADKLGYETDLLVAQGGTYGIMQTNPLPAKVIFFDFVKEGYYKSLKFLWSLRGIYDVSFTIYPSYPRQYHWVARAIGANRRIGHKFETGYFTHFHFLYTDKVLADQKIHNIYNNMNLLKPLGFDLKPAPMEAYLIPEDDNLAEIFLKECNLQKNEYIFFHNGSSLIKPNSEKKRLSSATVDKLMNLFLADGCNVLYNAGPDERYIPNIKGLTILQNQKIRTVGALIKNASVVVSNDSGPMHYAVALGQKVVAIYGNTDAAKAYPFTDKSVVIQSDWTCAPCYLDYSMRSFPCTNPAFKSDGETFPCMESFDEKQIFNAAVKLIDE